MLKDEALAALKEGKTLYTPQWYITMPVEESGNIFATCGYDGCCDNDWENFEEFWSDHSANDELRIL